MPLVKYINLGVSHNKTLNESVHVAIQNILAENYMKNAKKS